MVDITRVEKLTPEVSEIVDDMFTYHTWDSNKQMHGNAVREALSTAVKVIILNVPPCPDRSAAIRKIREARMDCNSAITHEGKY